MVDSLQRISGQSIAFTTRLLHPADGPPVRVVTGVEWDCPRERLTEAAGVVADGFCAASASQIGAALFRLRTLTRRRAEAIGEHDDAAEARIWIDELLCWPGDIVLDVLRAWPLQPGKGQFWPSWQEILADIKARCEPRMALVNLLRRLETRAIAAPVQVHEHITPETPEDRAATVKRLWEDGLRAEIAARRDESRPQKPAETPEEALSRLSGLALPDVIAKLNALPDKASLSYPPRSAAPTTTDPNALSPAAGGDLDRDFSS